MESLRTVRRTVPESAEIFLSRQSLAEQDREDSEKGKLDFYLGMEDLNSQSKKGEAVWSL